MKITSIQPLNDCLHVKCVYGKGDNKLRIGIISDVHFDSKKCDRIFLKRMLESYDYIIDNGDFFDVMGGKYDPRSTKDDIRPEYAKGNYFDVIVEDATKFLMPYKDKIICMVKGNHEISVRERHETDLTQRLAHNLGVKHVINYAGWIKYSFSTALKVPANFTAIQYTTHGTDGNAPVTRGVIQSQRRMGDIDCDLLTSGHIHTEYTMPRYRKFLTERGTLKVRKVQFLQIGTMKVDDGYFHTRKGFSPSQAGAGEITFEVVASSDLEIRVANI